MCTEIYSFSYKKGVVFFLFFLQVSIFDASLDIHFENCQIIPLMSPALTQLLLSLRRQIIIIDSAFPIKSDARFGSQIRQVEEVDSEQGFRIHNFNFLFFGGLDNLSNVICLLLAYWMKSFPLKIIKLQRTSL